MDQTAPTTPLGLPIPTRAFLRQHRLLVALAPAVALVLYFPFSLAWRMLWSNPDNPEGYQPLVPVAAAVLVWARRAELAAMWERAGEERRGSLWLLALGCLLMVYSHLTRGLSAAMLAVVLIAAGLVLHIYGPRILHAVRAPLLFLLALMPLPTAVADISTEELQLDCSQAAGTILSFLHIPAHVDGNVIHLPHYDVQVTAACSGVTILLPLMLLALWLLLLLPSSGWQKAVLLTSAAVIAVMVNVARITAVGLIGAFSPRIASALHDANGWLFTGIAFLLLYGVSRIIGIPRECTDPPYDSFSS